MSNRPRKHSWLLSSIKVGPNDDGDDDERDDNGDDVEGDDDNEAEASSGSVAVESIGGLRSERVAGSSGTNASSFTRFIVAVANGCTCLGRLPISC